MTGYDLRQIPGEAALEDAFAVRQAVFVDEQGVDAGEEYDGRDRAASHVVAYDGGFPVGTARLRVPRPDVAKIERVAVRKPYREQGIGRCLMSALEAESSARGCVEIRLHAQTAVEAFYANLGYETTSDVFDEAGIPHVEMRKPLE